MPTAKHNFLERLFTIKKSLYIPNVIDGLPTETEHNNIARLLRNGLAVVGFVALEDFIKNQDDHQRYIVLTNQQPLSQLRNEYNKFLSIPIGHILSFNSKKVFVDRKAFEQHYLRGFRAVIFYPDSGELRVNGRVIYTAIHTTSEYHFIEALWAKFNEPLSHKIIAGYIRTEMKFDYVDLAPKLCHKQKNKIKDKSLDPILIDRVFSKTKDGYGERGYIMHDPI